MSSYNAVAEDERVQVTNDNYDQYGASYNPTESKIVYTSREDGEGYGDIWIMNSDGSRHRRLTDSPGSDMVLSWSPDGRRIAWQSRKVGSPWEIWVMNADGSEQTNVTQNESIDRNPSWSPFLPAD